jgi:hypothetical protein
VSGADSLSHGSKRAYQTQFRRWNFPSKQKPAHKDGQLVARVKELWGKNLSQKEMLRVLNEEDGFEIKHRELMRVRSRNRWLLRTPNPDKTSTRDAILSSSCNQLPLSPRTEPLEDGSNVDADANPKQDVRPSAQEAGSVDQPWGSHRKERRRTRAPLGSVASSSRQSRFPSETTIDESRIILELDTKLYSEVRSHFASICDEEGVSRKTVAGPEKWEATKSRLIQEVTHLQCIMWANQDNIDSKRLALDVICTDVTKRMRSMEHKLTIASAKNVLGINPEEYRTIRQDLVRVLQEDHTTDTAETGTEHWDELKNKWLVHSTTLRGILSTGDVDNDKLRAVDVVARDVMKRLRDGRSKKSSPITQSETTPHTDARVAAGGDDGNTEVTATPEDHAPEHMHMEHALVTASPAQYPRPSTPSILDRPEAANTPVDREVRHASRRDHLQASRQSLQHHHGLQTSLSHSSILPHDHTQHQPPLLSENLLSTGLPIDPQINGPLPMLLNGHGQPLSAQPGHASFPLTQDLTPGMANASHAYVQNPYTPQPTPRPPVAVYLRLHPSSPITITPSIWIATLAARTFEELRQIAVKDFAGTACGRVEGILGEDMTIEVSRDDELTAYLAVAEGRNSTAMSGPPCFYVQLLPSGWKT